MTLILSNKDVDDLLTMPECIDALEDAYRELGQGRGVNRRRSDSLVPGKDPETFYGLKTMDGIVPKFGVSAVRINSDVVSWPTRAGTMRREKIPAAPGNRWVGLILLFSSETGEPLAIFPDGYLQRLRVGAANGLAAKYLSRTNAEEVALFGSGWQASGQLMAITAVRSIKRIRCYSPNAEHCRTFSKEMSEKLSVEIIPVTSPDDAVKGADIVICATNTVDNVLLDRWLEPGMHISSIKRPEIEETAIQRADYVLIHTHDDAPLLITPPGLVIPENENGKGWNAIPDVNFDALPTLPELIAGKFSGRESPEQITCFLNNLGMGYQFAAAGAAFYRKAKAAGRGHELPTEMFTQDVHP
ncbi:MAG: alanine dehydrogenase [Gammaproteobacteria bacterium]|jgi:alanine dehydrogenase